MTIRRSLVACLLAALAILPGCGERKEARAPKSLTVVRVALPPLNTGLNSLLAAKGAGYFEQAGLDVVPHVSGDGATAIQQVQQGKAVLGVASEPDLLEARGRGIRVISVATIVQHPLTSLIGQKLSLSSIVNLATKPIGTQGLDYQRAMAETIFKKAGGSARVVDVGDDLTRALNSKMVAAVIAPFGGPTLPGDVVTVPVDQLGVPTFSEYVLVVNENALDRDGDDIRGFVGALARGTRMLGSANAAGNAIPLKGAQVQRTRALMLPPDGKPYGWHDAAKWRAFAAWMKENRLPVNGSGAFTNQFLPGEGL